ncbi:hypothetical protein K2173_007751 [Erythroxylum novogranatense]|uniref:CBS domain-containing protein n=1 Tax=Erythroxylum novogranatense TaxID=1862640 RepID=A0AAV8TED9_9ROSI|nr:hypothetical protein K2173_007751 [Erythroxylum novogranatense]
MAVDLLLHVVSDLCLGKPALRSLPLSATIADTLVALKNSDDNFLSVWSCDHSTNTTSTVDLNGGFDDHDACRCVGKVCMVDVICYLCKEDNLLSPSSALKAPVSVLLPKTSGVIVHVEPSSSLVEAIDLILQGAQNLVVPIKTKLSSRRKQVQKLTLPRNNPTTIHKNGREFCWLTQEDIIRFLLGSIGLFSPLPAFSIDSLGIINPNTITTEYYSSASAAIASVARSLVDQTSVAVVDEGVLIGELSPHTLACCDETVAAAIATLSSGDLMAYIDCGGPPEDLVKVVVERLKEKGLDLMLGQFVNSASSMNPSCMSLTSSSDEESPVATLRSRSLKYSRSISYSARMARSAEAIVCHPESSLVAVMIQAIAHRVNYVWVTEGDGSLVGIVTFSTMLKVFRESLKSIA